MYSPDGRWWWNGAEWTPAPTWRTRYETTPWTRKLQIAVLALQVVALIFALASYPTIYDVAINGPMASNPALTSNPQTADFFRQFLLVVLVFTAVWTLVFLIVMVVGVLRLWRWIYWYLMITYGIAVIAIPANIISAVGNSPIKYPTWYYEVSTLLVIVEIALCVWMVIALRRYGAWARRKIVEQA